MRKEQLIGALALIGATAAFSAGCVAHAQAGGYAEAEAPVVFVEPPTLVSVDADVWVVRDYDYPVYYVSGYYWVYKSDRWYRAQSYDHGWTTVEVTVVPSVIVHRDHHVYIKYHGAATAQTKPAPKEGLASEPPPGHPGPPEHAAEQHGGPPGQNETPGLGNQKHGEEEARKEVKEERKEEKKEVKEVKKEEKKEDKKGDKHKK